VDLVARCNPGAVALPDARHGDTCLHIACRNSQTSDEKVRILLRHLTDADGVLLRNRFGGTALHSAANHNATLNTLRLLVEANPRVLKVTTREGLHAVSALWHAYLQTIPGTMSVARILQGGGRGGGAPPPPHEADAPFERLWGKVEYLAAEHYCRASVASPRMGGPPGRLHPRREDDARYALHGLLQCSAGLSLFKVALLKRPEWARVPDALTGSLPLHRLLNDRPYRLKEREAVSDCLAAYPGAAGVADAGGDYPLFVALRGKVPWESGVDLLVGADPGVAGRRDRASGLRAFQLAAAVGGAAAVGTCLRLLLTRPDLVEGGNAGSQASPRSADSGGDGADRDRGGQPPLEGALLHLPGC
jgi:ankyrin repeat protein